MSKKKLSDNDIPDVIDRIYDCLEAKMTPDDMKGYLRLPIAECRGMTPNEMLRAGKARELLAIVHADFGCPCSSTPVLVDNEMLQ